MSDVAERIRKLPIWEGPVAPERLKGGLSNESYTVTDGGRTVVVRLGEDFPFHHVSRAAELMAARAAAEAGFAPEVVHAEPGLMVSRFIAARTYDGAAAQVNVERIADIVRAFHAEMPRHVSGPGRLFWPFHVVRDYARTLRAGGSRFAGELDGYLALAEELERAQVPLPIVFGHNDLLPANVLDDGERLWLVDFEYAGFSTAMFDLAGIASNSEFAPEHDEALLDRYFGAAPSPELLRSHAAMKCASLLRESMWSMVSEIHLDTPGIDYEAYTAENLDRLDAALDSYRTRFGGA